MRGRSGPIATCAAIDAAAAVAGRPHDVRNAGMLLSNFGEVPVAEALWAAPRALLPGLWSPLGWNMFGETFHDALMR